MRLGCDWFVRRASKIWSVQHGRSFLVLVPQGCNDEAAAKLVNSWCLENFRPPVAFFDHQPLWISIVSDSQLTSHQVATRIARQINRQCGDDLGTDLDDYPSNIIQGAVDAALSHKRYPILFVRRFHAFASIQDGGMSSVLSQLRSLEMEGCLTTIAFSPMTYAAIRKSVDGSQAFLNSVYGDAHDLAVADPVSRAEFVSYAMSLGVVEQAAQRLFLYGGGPDKVFESLAHALVINEPDPVSYSVNQCSDVIEAFFERTLSEAGASMGSLLSALSVGKLDMSEEAFLKSNPMHNFFAKTDGVGRLVCNAAILTRWIWSNRAGRWSGYAGCLSFLRNGEWRAAIKLANEMASNDVKQKAFLALVKIYGAINVDLSSPFFGVDWLELSRACREAREVESYIPVEHKEWFQLVCRWSGVIDRLQSGTRLESDALTLMAHDGETRQLLHFLIRRYIAAATSEREGVNIDKLVNIPEVILQTLAVGKCGVNFDSAPQLPVDCNFQDYFNGPQNFRVPKTGDKITLTCLIVIVPAMLRGRASLFDSPLTDPTKIKSLQGSFVERIRNRKSHAMVELTRLDRRLLADVCLTWTREWSKLEGYEAAEVMPGALGFPTVEDLETMLAFR